MKPFREEKKIKISFGGGPRSGSEGGRGRRCGRGKIGASCSHEDFSLFVDFYAFLISLWMNTPLTDTLIKLGGLHALWAY